MSHSILLLYFCTWSLVAITPGPAVMCSMEQSTRFGFQASLVGIAGIQVGNLFYFLATAFGLVGFLAAGTTAFSVLKAVGAVYLIYLGSRICFRTFRGSSVKENVALEAITQRRGLFVHGLMIQITNPKTLLFVSALLPQFIQPRSPWIPQIAVLAAITVTVDLIVLSSYALLAARSVSAFKRSALAPWLERALGGMLIFFGVRLFARK